ncbi:hypothetical protein KDW_47070 [Dictyobacter vulcani]|uniref:Uncharacterized protein n=1 Tax=Dictyobacter vulcani TaxID=2607529 RepID=A0A5J4KRM3_9CHLR|nr:hypothetical protein [Dictyobacter vulcani]GER90545.1 hypothetical protein KDW_47070 [Dictyobacter vulcani]
MLSDITEAQQWSQRLQRRVIRLLLQHDAALFRQQFRLFTAQSQLPQIPLLQYYDQAIKLQFLSNELLDDILPRIRRQLSLKTTHKRLLEEAPTRGEIDWPQTIQRSQQHTPGQLPLQLLTRVRQRDMETPENVLAVALTLQLRQELQQAMNTPFEDEELSRLERQFFSSADEHAQRELATTHARQLKAQASSASIPALVQQVTHTLRPGASPYRDLLHWWQRFSQFRVGRIDQDKVLALSSTRQGEKTDAWLYELWVELELIHLLHEESSITPNDVTINSDRLQCTFTWQNRRFRLLYNRQLDTSTGYQADWQHGPASRPDYTIEREKPLEIRHQQQLIWREPAVILDAKYYLNGSDPTLTHNPIKKMLGDMSLMGASTGALFFPTIAEPLAEQEQHTRIIQRSGQQYQQQPSSQSISLYRLYPDMPFASLQQRLRAILDMAAQALPERPQPICLGIRLNPHMQQTILCPKPHIGPNIFDLVQRQSDCLQSPRLCHVIGQNITPRSGKANTFL